MQRNNISSRLTIYTILLGLAGILIAQDNDLFVKSQDAAFAPIFYAKKHLSSDFDQDGLQDVLVLDDSTFDRYGIQTFQQSGIYKKTGSKYEIYQALENHYVDGYWSDIDGDHKVDIAAIRRTDDGSYFLDSYLLKEGSYELTQSLKMKGFDLGNTEHSVHNPYYRQYFALADYDGDGDLDLFSSAVVTSLDQYRTFYARFENGMFEEQTEIEGFKNIDAIQAFDIDLDLDQDLVLTLKDVSIGIIENSGTGFNFKVDTLDGIKEYRFIQDLDNDGQLEFIADSIYEVSEGFQLSSQGVFSPEVPSDVWFIDYDQDGLTDILEGMRFNEEDKSIPELVFKLLWNRGNFRFQSIPLPNVAGRFSATADVDGDGYPDIITDEEIWLNSKENLSGFILANKADPQRWFIYPTHVSDVLNWKISNKHQDTKLVLISLDGKKTEYELPDVDEGTIDTSTLKSGLYIVRITSDNSLQKIIID